MKQPRLTRRRFLQLSALSTVGAIALPAIGLAAVAAAPSQEALAAAQQPQGPAIPQPTFNPIASTTPFGSLTDISMGWDGTLWGIDGQGAPHVFDSINNVWAQHGEGIDAAAINGAYDTIYVFQGPNVVPINSATLTASAPTTIAALWPTLPDSFKLGVTGAMTNPDGMGGGGLILFNGGRYISTEGLIPLSKLIDLPGWPQTAPWTENAADPALKDGIIDVAFNVPNPRLQFLQRAGQVLTVSINQAGATVVSGPQSFADWVQYIGAPLPADWVSSGGIDACTVAAGTDFIFFFEGTSVLSFVSGQGTTATQYIGKTFVNWPSTWHPVLAHAPNSRDGNLWSVAQNGSVVQHNGESWAQLSQQATHAGVGQDNTVIIANAGQLLKFNGTGFDAASKPSALNLQQVSLGSANAVFARDASNNVYSFDPVSGNLTQNTSVGAATHIATTSDGSLWHAKPNDPNMHRFLTSANVLQAGIPVKQGIVSTVNKVAATGFGAAHCLTEQDGQMQAYRYDSPYIFKTSSAYTSGSAVVAQGLGRLYITDVQSDVLQGTEAGETHDVI